MVENEDRATPEQIVLPLAPDMEGTADPSVLGRNDAGMSAAKGLKGESENEASSREEKPVRRQRLKSPVSVVDIKRVVKAATVAGLPVSSLEVRPDGTIVLGTTGPANDDSEDVFAKWADRL